MSVCSVLSSLDVFFIFSVCCLTQIKRHHYFYSINEQIIMHKLNKITEHDLIISRYFFF